MRPAYQLKRDLDSLSKVQKATLSTDEFGIEQTHGLFGSSEWWEQISSGRLPLHMLCGEIIERFWSGMADWPEIRIRSDDGQISEWTRKVNVKEQGALYIPGQRIEIDYVLQRHRPKSTDKGAEHKIVIEIRVEPNPQMETPGIYEKLLARELAQAVCLNYIVIIDASHQLGELGNTPGVMDEEAHQVFTSITREVEGVIMQNRYEAMEALLNHWKDPVLAACKRLSEEKS
ncbi:MAG TPA: hypothetical protein VKB81_20155 [Nitrospira sp.]|nr:hypothetical protein [Nitrospira sp.]